MQEASQDEEIRKLEKLKASRKAVYDDELKIIRDRISQLRKSEEEKSTIQLPPKSKSVEQVKAETEELEAQLNYRSTEELSQFFATLDKVNSWKIAYKEQLQSLLREAKQSI